MSATSLPDQFDLSRVVLRTFNAIRRNLAVFATLTLVLYGIPKLGASIADIVTDGDSSWFHGGMFGGAEALYQLIAGLGYFVLQASIVHGAAADLAGRPADIMSCLRTGIRFFLPLLGLFILTLLAVLVGLVALIIPGLMLIVMWIVAVPAEVVEGSGISGALRRSAYLTEGYRWPIFGILAVFFVITVLFGNSVSQVQEGFFHALPMLGQIPHYAMSFTKDLFSVIAGLVASVGVASLYFELRMVKEGATPDEMIELLDRESPSL